MYSGFNSGHFSSFFSMFVSSIMKKLQQEIFQLRVDFDFDILEEKDVKKDPFEQFSVWMQNALDAKVHEPTAMTLATAGKKGKVDARIVLLRDFDKKGFNFFTNYTSAKGKEMKENKYVALNFFWPDLQRQVRIRGTIVKLSDKRSDEYFASRPRQSQIGAWASHQSEPLSGRKELEDRVKQVELKFKDKKVPRPKHWGGYTVVPVEIEFWQGRTSRLHDRILFTKMKTGKWKFGRLNP